MRSSAQAIVVFALLAALAVAAFAQDDSGDAHADGGRMLLTELDSEMRPRVRSLWSRVVCACKRENWSRSLLHCPDGCADQQKNTIATRVSEGWGDTEILAEQRNRHGPKVIGAPDSTSTYLMPFLVLAAAGVLAVLTLLHMRGKPSTASKTKASDASDDEVSAVLRELEEID